MRSIRTVGLAAAAAVVLGVSAMSPASAQRGFGHGGGGFHGAFHGGGWRGGGWHGGGWRHGGWGFGPAVAGGLAFGALAAAPYYYGYGYGYGCGPQVVGYDVYGQPVIADGCD